MAHHRRLWNRRPLLRPLPPLCRFAGCDSSATATVGTMPLCALHRTYVEQLMDSGELAFAAAPQTDRRTAG